MIEFAATLSGTDPSEIVSTLASQAAMDKIVPLFHQDCARAGSM